MEVDNNEDEENEVISRSFSRPFAQHAGNPHVERLCYSKNLWDAVLLLISQITFVIATELVCHVTFVISCAGEPKSQTDDGRQVFSVHSC